MKKVDFVIIGGGVAGMSAAVYAARFGMEVVLVSEEFGGLIATTHLVENYPGMASVSGFDLAMGFKKHVESLDVPMVTGRVQEVVKDGEGYVVKVEGGEELKAGAILLATGSKHRKLGVKGEDEYYAKGVSYCATCDGMFFAGRKVAVVGGSDSAAKQALYLAEMAESVKVLYRKAEIRAEPINKKRVEENSRIEVIPNVNVVEVKGDGQKMTGVVLDNGEEVELDGLFIEIGYVPQTDLAERLGVALNERGEVKIDKHSQTSVPGIYAAGDNVDEEFKQAVVAAAQGVHAAHAAYDYVQSLKGNLSEE